MRRILFALKILFLVAAFPQPASASLSKYDFDEGVIYQYAPSCSGVYVIYKDGTPFYVGRSTRNIAERLRDHVRGNGSTKVRDILEKGYKLQFVYYCSNSPEQFEAILIEDLGTTAFGNLRRESDPGDQLGSGN